MHATPLQQILPSLLPQIRNGALAAAASRMLGVNQLASVYEAIEGSQTIAEDLLHQLSVTYRITDAELGNIPRSGGVMIVANHPSGVLEGAVLAAVVRRMRPDVRVLANGLIGIFPEAAELVISVDVLSKGATSNPAGLRRALRHLRSGGALIVFPSGEVAHREWRSGATVDPPWHPSVARLASIAEVPVVPVHVSGGNSLLFHAMGALNAQARTALLGRELLNKRGAEIHIRVAKPVSGEKLRGIEGDARRIEYLRWRSDLLAAAPRFKASTSKYLQRQKRASQEPLVNAVAPDALAAEITGLDSACLLESSGELSVYLVRSAQAPLVLAEIGRLRELTFRAAGEGTGRATDFDSFDSHYEHLFLWHRTKHEIVGAYRLRGTQDGAAALYTRTLFGFDDKFLRAMGPAMELGRSFIREEYQRGFTPLLLLWKGIGKVVARHPERRVLFGAVSISDRYQSASRDLMISFLEKQASLDAWKRYIRPVAAPKPAPGPMLCDDLDELAAVVSDVEAAPVGVPVLLRQYLKLGGRLIGFNVDRDFSNALDGLIAVDLTRTEPKLLSRYLGRAEAETFLHYHEASKNLALKGHDGTH